MENAIIISVLIVCVTVVSCFHIVHTNKRKMEETKMVFETDRAHYEFLRDGEPVEDHP